MKDTPQLPRARSEGLIQERLDDELLVYDLERHQAHCLNRTAALVWEHCDGRSTAQEIARRIEPRLGAADENLVKLALEQLAGKRLLQEPAAGPRAKPGLSRRELMYRLGLTAAAAVPLITTILAPEPIEAVTCLMTGELCSSSGQCCSGLCAAGMCA